VAASRQARAASNSDELTIRHPGESRDPF